MPNIDGPGPKRFTAGSDVPLLHVYDNNNNKESNQCVTRLVTSMRRWCQVVMAVYANEAPFC